MTQEQKQLLRAVPVALVMVGAIFVFYLSRAEKLPEESDVEPVAGPSSQQIQDSINRAQLGVDRNTLAVCEKQLEKDEAFVLSAEAACTALRAAPRAEEIRKLNQATDTAVEAIAERLKLLEGIRNAALSEAEKARVAMARERHAAMLERLKRCRIPIAGP